MLSPKKIIMSQSQENFRTEGRKDRRIEKQKDEQTDPNS